MDILETVRRWVANFPGWEAAAITVDCIGADPDNGGLFPKGLELVKVSEDVLGNEKHHLRCGFLLRYVGKAPDGTDGGRLLEFQRWVYTQSAAGLAPSLGENTRWRAEKGQLEGDKGPGTGVYTVTLTAEFTKIYE